MAPLSAFLFLFALLVSFAWADDACNWSPPNMYSEYSSEVCPPPRKLLPNGRCEGFDNDPSADHCQTYCEIRTNFEFAQEQPYLRVPPCRGPGPCALPVGIGQSLPTQMVAIDFKDARGSALAIGITNGFVEEKYGLVRSPGLSTADLRSCECGYWTFLPIIQSTCGTFTNAWKLGALGFCELDSPKSVPNACVHQPFRDKLMIGKDKERYYVHGESVFVRTDCRTFDPLPDEKQPEAYRRADIKLPPEKRRPYTAFYKAGLCKQKPLAWNEEVNCKKRQEFVGDAKFPDCIEAVALLLDEPAKMYNQAPPGRHTLELARSGKCAIQVKYMGDEKKWDPACFLSRAEVAANAQVILDKCKFAGKDDERVMGSKLMVGPDRCKMEVLVARLTPIRG